MSESRRGNRTNKATANKNTRKTSQGSRGGKSQVKSTGKRSQSSGKTVSYDGKTESSRINSRVKDEIIAIIVIAVGIFLVIALQTSVAGMVGTGLSQFFKGCFGFAAYILPYYFIVYGVLLFAKKTISAGIKSVALLLIIFLMISIINSARFISGDAPEFGFGDIPVHYSNGIVLDDGGVFGMTVGGIIVKLIGIPGLYIFSVVVIAICLLLVMNTPVSRFLENVKSRKEKYEEDRKVRLREKELEKQERLRQMEMNRQEEYGLYENNSDNITESQKKILSYLKDESDSGSDLKKYNDVFDDGTAEAVNDFNQRETKKEEKNEELEKFKKTPIIVGGFSPRAAEEKISKAEAAKSTLREEDFNVKIASGDDYEFPPIDILKAGNNSAENMASESELRKKAEKLEDTLHSFNIDAEVTNVTQGPTVTRYEVHPNVGVKVSGITNLANDIALNMEAKSIRIEAPIPGKPAVGIEIENEKNNMVTIREIIGSSAFKKSESKITFAVGMDIEGNAIVSDLKSMPHLLIAGSTGSGKSVCINSIITSLLYKATPDEVKLVLIDPKVVELANYNGIPHLLIPVVTEPAKAAAALNWAVAEMDDRYRKFAEEGVREISSYNKTVRGRNEEESVMPQIVIIIDELADLMMVAKSQVEESICRLAQKARAAGMHLIVATQRPSTDVVTGLIKANIPSRIAFAVSSHHDSMTILDMSGAEKLVGKGDMLFNPLGSGKPLRVQGTFISDSEVNDVIDFVKSQMEDVEYSNNVLDSIEKANTSVSGKDDKDEEDEFLPDAIELVVDAQQASVSMLQRRFRIGYNRAARIIDMMEERQIIGPSDGSRPRQVLLSKAEFEDLKNSTEDMEK